MLVICNQFNPPRAIYNPACQFEPLKSTIMRLLANLVALSKCHQRIEETWDEVNEEWVRTDLSDYDHLVADDMRFSPCQAELYKRKGVTIPADLIEPGEGQ